ncbi:hypothetical protein R3P38DRAFT_3167339 [Favolaschia claudopus]|uniref:Uncharacterized protein n=1 Tax=Favolaschia claudopus TaxID=2862362 RepID=A0AAW0EG02_9AGAR
MGRRSKFLSLDQKVSAKRESDLRYIHSPRGKTVRAAYRQSSQRRKQRKNNTLLDIPSPTERMLTLYAKPFPTHSRLFADALRSPDALDESDLARWKREPPFEEDDDDTDPHSLGYLRFTQSLCEVLHGVRLREQNQRDAELRSESTKNGRGAVELQLHAEVRAMFSTWDRVEKLLGEGFYHPYHQSREHAMLEHYFEWLGRSICHLYYAEFLDD